MNQEKWETEPGRTRRLWLAGAATALAGCAVPAALRPAAPPVDRAAVFRALYPGERVVPLAAPESRWHVVANAPAGVDLAEGGLRFASVPGRRAWASPRLPLAPLGSRPPGQVEELTWEAAVTLERRFFVICELRFAGEPGVLLIQATPFDLQVFRDPERPGEGTSDSVSRLVGDGRTHFWRLRLDGARLELRLDGSNAIWALDGARTLSRVAFGETRTDDLHGGSMLLRDLVYVRRPA